jgi:hypothetical protein
LFLPQILSAKSCDKGKKVFITLQEIRPTQFSLGMLSIQSKMADVESAYKKGD